MNFDLLRHADGVLSLENSLINNNCFWEDAAIKRFRHFVNYLNRSNSGYRGVTGRNWQKKLSKDFLEISNDFISSLVRSEKRGELQYYNPHTVPDCKQFIFMYFNYLKRFYLFRMFLRLFDKDKLIGNSSVILLNNMSREDFISHAAIYLENVFKLLQDYKTITVMHPLMISGDIEHQLRYLGNAKVVISNRDPRDVYVDVSKKKIEYIPWENLDDFIFWYKKMHSNYPIERDNILNINYEDLAINYEDTSSKIIDFLEINEFKRNTKTIFNPEISRKNVGIFKSFHNQSAIKYIEKELSEFCYYTKAN